MDFQPLRKGDVKVNRLCNKLIDRVLVTDTKNEILKTGECTFKELIWDYLFNYDLPKYRSDSLKIQVSED